MKNSKQQTWHDLGAHYNNLVSYNDVKNIFVSRKETFPMETALDMGNHTIFNVKDPKVADQGANMRYVDSQSAKKLSLEGGTMTGNLDMNSQQINNIATPTLKRQPTPKSYVDNAIGGVVAHTMELEEKLKKYVNESHITSTSHPKDAFRYLMENVDESSSEHDMEVTAISDFASSPHHFNKKAFDLKITKDHFNEYDGRLGFNMFKLPEGEYTLCIEFFPASMDGVSVDVVSTSLNINQQSTKKFSGYSRSIIHMHKWRISPPEFIFLDLKWRGTAESAEKGNAKLIIYGVAGSQSDVESSVFDSPFVFESGAMVMETDLDLNGHNLSGSRIVETGVFRKNDDSHKFLFIGSTSRFLFFPMKTKLVEVGLFHASITNVPKIDLTFSMSVNNRKFERTWTGNRSRSQKYNIGDGIEIPSMTNFSFSPQDDLVIGLNERVYLSLVFETR